MQYNAIRCNMQFSIWKTRVSIFTLQDARSKLQFARCFEEDIRDKTQGSIFTMQDTRCKKARFTRCKKVRFKP